MKIQVWHAVVSHTLAIKLIFMCSKTVHCECIYAAPPGGCYDIQVVSTTDSTINVMWRKPNFTGRADYYYNVYYSNPNSAGAFILHNKCPYVDVGGLVEYSVTTLLPQTNYAVRVTVHNGVSDQDLENIHLRTCEVTASTTDGCK